MGQSDLCADGDDRGFDWSGIVLESCWAGLYRCESRWAGIQHETQRLTLLGAAHDLRFRRRLRVLSLLRCQGPSKIDLPRQKARPRHRLEPRSRRLGRYSPSSHAGLVGLRSQVQARCQ